MQRFTASSHSARCLACPATRLAGLLLLALAAPLTAQDSSDAPAPDKPEARLEALGISLPTPPSPVANCVNGVQ